MLTNTYSLTVTRLLAGLLIGVLLYDELGVDRLGTRMVAVRLGGLVALGHLQGVQGTQAIDVGVAATTRRGSG